MILKKNYDECNFFVSTAVKIEKLHKKQKWTRYLKHMALKYCTILQNICYLKKSFQNQQLYVYYIFYKDYNFHISNILSAQLHLYFSCNKWSNIVLLNINYTQKR